MKILFLGPTDSILYDALKTLYSVTQTEYPITTDVARGFDWLISYGYRHIIKKPVLDLFPRRAINLHISLLPWNRGADPNYWSWRDDTPRGVTIHFLDEGIDTGDIIVQREVEMRYDETLATSYKKLQKDIEQLFCEYWPAICNGTLRGYKQPQGGSFHRKADRTWNGPWDTPVKEIRMTSKRVLIDPGHSEKRTGARGKNASVQEEDLNRYQAERLATELALLGISADIIDPIDDDLWSIGKKANGYAAFVSLHLNAFNAMDHYTCAMVHPKWQPPTSKSARVAGQWAEAISEALGSHCFTGSSGYPKGVMAAGLSVLSGCATTDCPVFFLSEAFFVDAYDSNLACRAKILAAMKAGAKVLADVLT